MSAAYDVESPGDTVLDNPAPGETAPGETAPGETAPGETAAVDTAGADVVRTWREMVASHAAVCASLEHELGERHGLGVSEFEVLDRLAESPEGQARAQDLAESVHLSQSALSRLVDRLVKNALVERCACDMDRRGIYVVLTADGLGRHHAAAATHREVLTRLLPGA